MTTENAIRFLHHEAALCRGLDASEAFCLLLPALIRIFELEPMEDPEAEAFRYQFKQRLQALPFRDAADREASRPAALAHAVQSSRPGEKSRSDTPGARPTRPAPPGRALEPAPAAS